MLRDDTKKIEERILTTSVIFVMSLFSVVAASVKIFDIGLPTCLKDIRPFQKGEVLFHTPTHYEVHFVSRMWNFEPAEVKVPLGSTVDIYLSTVDVTHGLLIPGTNVNLMAVPGAVNYARVKFARAGVYPVICHEYCGTGHQEMSGVIKVIDPAVAKVEDYLTPGVPAKPSDPGFEALQRNSCLACHTVDGRPGTGPSLKGIFGKREPLVEGGDVLVDEAYLRESVRDPLAKTVKGYSPVMPKLPVSDADLNLIVEYIKTLK